jgi:nucleoside-diphosphate-sugar epimerase
VRRLDGDIIVLGAGGKMGPTLARMARNAVDGTARKVFAVSRFTDKTAARGLLDAGIHVIRCDLLDAAAVAELPAAPNVVFMAGQKFGTRDAPSRTWMMNVVVPSICADRYAASRIVAFSTGNVYPLVPVNTGGAREHEATGAIGEYAASCVGRERVFEHYAATRGIRVAIVRLNYAIDLRYGVLTDLAVKIMTRTPIPLAMGHVNIVWQGDACAAALQLLPLVETPPLVVNVTGSHTLAVRDLALALGARLGIAPAFEGREAADALLSNTTRMQTLTDVPGMPVDTMLDWVATWVLAGRPLLGKPTSYETRDGSF